MKTIYTIMMACMLCIFASCTKSKKTENEEVTAAHTEEITLTQAQLKTVGITLGQVERKELDHVLRVNGELCLNPQDISEVSSLMEGVVRKVCVVEGQRVKAGQTVAYVENTEIVEMQKNYLIAVRECEMAKQELQRQRMLSKQDAGVEKILQQAVSDYEIASARKLGLHHQLVQVGIHPERVIAGQMMTQIPLHATISGVVSRVYIKTGSRVDAASALMEIVNNAAVYARLNVFERDIHQVRVGQNVELIITNAPDIRLNGRVNQVNRSMDKETKAVSVHVRITDKDTSALIPGMYVSGLIHFGQEKVTALPDDAIVRAENKNYVFVLEEEEKEEQTHLFHFKRVEVITGISELGYTQIDFVTPIDLSATIVTGHAFYLASVAADHGEH